MDTHITGEDAGLLIVEWARAQLDQGVGENLVQFCVILALRNLLVDGHAELPDLQELL